MPAKLNKPLMDIRWEKNHWHGHLRFSKYFFFFDTSMKSLLENWQTTATEIENDASY